MLYHSCQTLNLSLILFCMCLHVCATITAAYCQLTTSNETTFKQSLSLAALWKATNSSPSTPSSFRNAEKCFKYLSRIMCFVKCFLLHWLTISGSWQINFWTYAGSSHSLSGSWVIVFNAKHVSHSPSSPLTTLYAVPSDYFNIIHKKASPITYLCCLEQPSYVSATSILQLLPNCLQKPLSCHFLALLVSFLLCDFDVVIQLNGNFPQKTGYMPPVTFFTCIFRHLIQWLDLHIK